MQIQIALPDDLAQSLQAKWGSLERRLLEMIVIQAYFTQNAIKIYIRNI